MEQRLSILALGLFIVLVYGLDLKYYLQPLSCHNTLPALENTAGLMVFFFLLSRIWLQARPLYERLFHQAYRPWQFVVFNIKINLPIILPWLILSFIFDLFLQLPVFGVKDLLTSSWGDYLVFCVFVFFLMILFPPLVKWLWGCHPIPEGPDRQQIQDFCRRQAFSSEILFWPLFEGQVLTAGVMGIVPGLRYLLITPALLQVLDKEELNSVLAHEIGHVKHRHLLLYLALFLSFSLLAGSLARPLYHFILAGEAYYWILSWSPIAPEYLLSIMNALFYLFFLLIYFRFIFGFFIRHFERQADGYVFTAVGTAQPLIRAFEKISQLSGTRRSEKNWHHFGIGERIDFLVRAESDPSLIRRQGRKINLLLCCYAAAVTACILWTHHGDEASFFQKNEIKYAKAVLSQKARLEPDNSTWPLLLGDVLFSRKMEREAVAAYEQALAIQPGHPEANNNLAWLLLTAQDKTLLDPEKALELANRAAQARPQGYILDTLAMAYWANGMRGKAVETEYRAIQLDPENQHFYQQQIKTFQSGSWTGNK